MQAHTCCHHLDITCCVTAVLADLASSMFVLISEEGFKHRDKGAASSALHSVPLTSPSAAAQTTAGCALARVWPTCTSFDVTSQQHPLIEECFKHQDKGTASSALHPAPAKSPIAPPLRQGQDLKQHLLPPSGCSVGQDCHLSLNDLTLPSCRPPSFRSSVAESAHGRMSTTPPMPDIR